MCIDRSKQGSVMYKFIYNLFRASLLSTIIMMVQLSLPAYAKELYPNVFFAGVAISGNAKDTLTDFPLLSQLVMRPDQTNVEVAHIIQVITQNIKSDPNLPISLEQASTSEESIAVALVFTWENQAVDRVGSSMRLTVDIHAQALFFDYATKRIIRSYPFAFQHIDAFESPPSATEIERNFKELLYGENGITTKFISILRYANDLSRADSVYIKVAVNELDMKARNSLISTGLSIADVTDTVGRTFSQYLSKNAGIPILPYAKDQAIGGKMAAQFADGTIFNFEIPSPDFIFEITMKEFREKLLSTKQSGNSYGFAVYYKIKLFQPLTKKIYLSNTYRSPVVATFPITKKSYNSAKWFHNSVFSLSDKFTSSIVARDKKWLAKWGVQDYDKMQIQETLDVIEKAK